LRRRSGVAPSRRRSGVGAGWRRWLGTDGGGTVNLGFAVAVLGLSARGEVVQQGRGGGLYRSGEQRLGVRDRWTGAHGTDAGACPTPAQIRCGGGGKGMECGSRMSASAGGGRLRWAAERAPLGAGPAKRSWAGPKASDTRARGKKTRGRGRTSPEMGRDANGLGRRRLRAAVKAWEGGWLPFFLLLFPFFKASKQI
jgi:hypothetical protein